jgi:hypothetical protein
MRKTTALAVTITALVSAVQAQTSLQGHWNATIPSNPSYSGVVLIDADHRATLDGKGSRGTAWAFGYAEMDANKVRILLTNRVSVLRFDCALAAPNRLECDPVQDGAPGVRYVLTRVGPGPRSLMPASP